MLNVTLTEASDGTCVLKEVTDATSVQFQVPVSKATLVAALRAILLNPEARDITAASVLLERMRDGIRLHAGGGAFMLRYQSLYPLVIEG